MENEEIPQATTMEETPINTEANTKETAKEETVTEKQSIFSKIKKATTGSKTEIKTESETDKLQEEKQELQDKYLRLFAEFDNYKRRTAKERIELIGQANADLLLQLLPVIDDMERALQHSKQNHEVQHYEGYELISNKIKNILDQRQVSKMQIEAGSEFDPDHHEAITEIQASEDLAGKIVDVVQSGYSLAGKVLRHAKVVIGKTQEV